MSLAAGWPEKPEANTERDVEQAIAAKCHLALRVLPILAEAQLVTVNPDDVMAIPPWIDDEEPAGYAAEASLPASPLFLDFEMADGGCAAWDAESWPLAFNLRGATCWVRDGLLSVVPFGSVGGVHPWGGTDYQAWSRWLFAQDEVDPAPDPGPGDCVVRLGGEITGWVDLEGDSICAHQAIVGYNLTERVLRVLWAFQLLDVKFAPPSLPRAERRRAARAGQTVGLTPVGMPRLSGDAATGNADSEAWVAQMTETCPIHDTHTRLNQAHTQWHAALSVYDDPEAFVTKLNALIQTLRNITFALQTEIAHRPALEEWYKSWQERMKSDTRMRWAVEARNHIVKQGDLDTDSKAYARLVGDMLVGRDVEIEVPPRAPADEIARRVQLPALSGRTLREGTLVVERRWVVGEFPDEELLEVLAHSYAVLATVVAEAHEELGASMDTCQQSADDPCGAESGWSSTTGRYPCMWAGREARTSRRSLSSGAPIGVKVRPVAFTPPDADSVRERYAAAKWEQMPDRADVFEMARVLHGYAREMVRVDGASVKIAWLLRDGTIMSQQTLWPEDHRDNYLIMETLAAEATRLGANELILTTEAWEAEAVDGGDPRASLRATERPDRTETLLTHVLQRKGRVQTWRSAILRTDRGVDLGDVQLVEDDALPVLWPIIEAWETWS